MSKEALMLYNSAEGETAEAFGDLFWLPPL